MVEVGRRYFAAFNDHDVEAMLACWHPDGEEVIAGRALPAAGRLPRLLRRAVRRRARRAARDARRGAWPATATSCATASPARSQGRARCRASSPPASRLSLVGLDMLTHRGRPHPPQRRLRGRDEDGRGPGRAATAGLAAGAAHGRPGQRGARGCVRRMVSEPERVADGVWIVRGGVPTKTMNVYLIEEDGGVALFDAGIAAMTDAPGRDRRADGRDHARDPRPRPRRPPRRGARPRRARRSATRPRWRWPSGDGGRVDVRLRQAAPADADADAAHAAVVGRRPGADRGHARGGRGGRGLPGRAHAGPLARPDRPVPRVGPPGADHRHLLHARPRDDAARARRASRTRRSRPTSTPPASRSAASPRWSPPPPGRATPTRWSATSASSSSAPRRRSARSPQSVSESTTHSPAERPSVRRSSPASVRKRKTALSSSVPGRSMTWPPTPARGPRRRGARLERGPRAAARRASGSQPLSSAWAAARRG